MAGIAAGPTVAARLRRLVTGGRAPGRAGGGTGSRAGAATGRAGGRGPAALPLDRSGADRFVPWMLAPMAFLATLALALTLALGGLVERWDRGLAGTLTVQLPAQDDPIGRQAAVELAISVLDATPGVARADPVSPERAAALIEPWLGDAARLDDLPIPILVDVRAEPGVPIDLAGLRQALVAAVPGAELIDHGAWLDELLTLAGTARVVTTVILLTVALAAVATVVSVTRAGLAIHAPVIDILHVMGAPDAYVARQFERHALDLALRGALAGFVLALGALVGLGWLIDDAAGALLPQLSLAAAGWLVLVLVPLAVIGLAVGTARVTTLRTLRQLP
jgi:cell division transport system permease protein